MGTSGAESLSGAANVFVGQTEAPLFIKPYIAGLTRSELLAVMVGGMCTTAGGVLAAYVQLLGQAYAEITGMGLEPARALFAGQLLGASLMAAPAGLAIAKVLLPETEAPRTGAQLRIAVAKEASGVIEAAAVGAADGLKLALNVAATLLAFVGLIALANSLLGAAGDWLGLNDWLRERFDAPLSLQLVLGMVLRWLGWAIGVPAADALNFGSLIGTKLVLNEFVAYLDFSAMLAKGVFTSEKTVLMASFALCGFANFASIAVQIGGIGPLAPERRRDIAALGLRAVLGGTLANLLTATIAGMFVGA
jgi:CNT family concentrative nucleoside transporter